MSQPTGQSYHMQGAVVVYTGTGVANAGEQLGMTEDGVDIRIEEFLIPVKTDAAGEAPADFQKMGARARIRLRLVTYDDAVLQHVLSRGDRTAAGELSTAGTLVHTNSYGFKVGLTGDTNATNHDDPWYFPNAHLAGATPVGAKLGSRYTIWDVELEAIGFVAGSATSNKDKVLYARAYPGGFPS